MTTYEKFAMIYRTFGLIILYFLSMGISLDLRVLSTILVLLILMLLRWRIPKLKYTIIVDQFVIVMASSFWGHSHYVFVLTAFEIAFSRNILLGIPIMGYMSMNLPSAMLLLSMLQSLFAGTILYSWRSQHELSLKRMDNERGRYYKVEDLNQDLLIANAQVAQMAELSERSRIAREIHDNAGHEIVAAYISLQTIQLLLDNTNSDVNELFDASMLRLESGIDKIREAVHNIAPITEIGVLTLESLCEKFTHCPVKFTVYGDSEKVSVHFWLILESCLKEGLTNIARHTDATNASVTLDITPYIVRLCIENDGIKKRDNPVGLGLYNLRSRAKAVGGNVSTDIADYFRLVCVLPIHASIKNMSP